MNEREIRKAGKKGATRVTRGRVLDILKREGALDVDTLGIRLEVTGMAVRQHLKGLQDDGLVCFEAIAEGRGRPQRKWSLTPAAGALFPDRHDQLLIEMLKTVEATFGQTGMEQLLEARAGQQLAQYSRAMVGSADLSDRLERLVAIRTEEGYMAELKKEPDGAFLLIENHCAICAAAQVCQGFCERELAVFSNVLGPKAQVERTEHLFGGSRRCVYRVSSEA